MPTTRRFGVIAVMTVFAAAAAAGTATIAHASPQPGTSPPKPSLRTQVIVMEPIVVTPSPTEGKCVP